MKLKTYVLTVSDFTEPEQFKDRDYTIVNMSATPLKRKYEHNVLQLPEDPMQLCNNELTFFKYFYENLLDKQDYVCIQHYRRYFQWIPDEKFLSDHKFILPVPIYVGNIYGQYSSWHNVQDLLDNLPLEGIIESEFLYTNNCFICSVEEFKKWYETIVMGIFAYNMRRNWKTSDDVIKWVNENPEKYHLDRCRDTYQARINGFLCERLSTLYWRTVYNQSEIYHIPLIQTTEKDEQAPKFNNQ